MNSSSISEASSSSDRFKLCILSCDYNNIAKAISNLKNDSFSVINLGKEIAIFINQLSDYAYLSIDVYDFIVKLLDSEKTKINCSGNDIICIYNLGILLEPSLDLNAVQLLKDFSKSTALVIIWENQINKNDLLNWTSNSNNYAFDFSDVQLKKIQYEI